MRYIISLLLTSVALPALADVPRVVTDLPPIHSLAAQVMGDLGTPALLLDRGGNAHDFQLRPSQAAALADADLILWVGPEMTPWLDRALESLSPDIPRLTLIDSGGTFRRDFGQTDAHDHEHSEEEAHAHDEAPKPDAAQDDHSGHDHSGIDPHAWLDPVNASHWAGVIAAELSRLDPENAATYAANAAKAQARIAAMDAEIADQLAPVTGKPFVVFHDAYGYFAGHYGLTVAGSVSLGDASSPGAARLRDLSNTVASGGAVCLFPEGQHDPALVTQMAEGTAVKVGMPLDPEGALIAPGPDGYDALMRGLAKALTDCLNG